MNLGSINVCWRWVDRCVSRSWHNSLFKISQRSTKVTTELILRPKISLLFSSKSCHVIGHRIAGRLIHRKYKLESFGDDSTAHTGIVPIVSFATPWLVIIVTGEHYTEIQFNNIAGTCIPYCENVAGSDQSRHKVKHALSLTRGRNHELDGVMYSWKWKYRSGLSSLDKKSHFDNGARMLYEA
jgi:hypothetical protein